ncbi:Hypothetical protein NTJ_12967 [Nesidiocoris tenuis]|uniref:Uncharacterized protein n=1 Tax=Nesidiocoris tenuis TaxID=355587 RepID=A0ABN7B6Y1_9HEMI|nr:Hypothetical protein NTJ_12967 [Nesidiocoris tenuis]
MSWRSISLHETKPWSANTPSIKTMRAEGLNLNLLFKPSAAMALVALFPTDPRPRIPRSAINYQHLRRPSPPAVSNRRAKWRLTYLLLKLE